MRKILLAVLLLFLSAISVQAQNTTVSGTVTDSGGVVWANGSYTFNFVPSPNWTGGPFFNNGVTYTPVPISGSLSGTGTFSVSIPSNSTITPSGSHWTVTYYPQATAAAQTSGNITITGSTQTITSNFIPTALVVQPGANQSVYSTAEAGSSVIGSQIYLIGTGIQYCTAVTGTTCTTWSSSSGGGITQVATLPTSCTSTSGPVQLTVAPYGVYYCNGASYQLSAPSSGIVYAANYGAQGRLQVESNGANFGSASGTTTVNCSTCNFTTSTFHQLVVGDIYWATNWSGTDTTYTTAVATIGLAATTPCTVTGSITNTSFVGSCTASANSGTNNANVGVLTWGPDDQTGNHLAKVAAYDGQNCQSLQLTGPFTNMDLPDFNTAACEGVSGGSVASKYVGLIGQNPSGNTTVLLPPWFGEGNISTLCNASTSGLACFGGVGGFFNLTFNGLGQSSFALGSHNILESANDVSWQDVYLWGFAANCSANNCGGLVFNAGLHIGINLIADGAGAIPCIANATVSSHLFSLECYNASSSGGNGLFNVNGNAICVDCVFGSNASSGIVINVAAARTYWGYNDFIQTTFAGGCWVTSSGTIHIIGGYCPNNGGATNASAITVSGAGYADATNSVLGGGTTNGIWRCSGSTAICVDRGGNTYGSTPIVGTGSVAAGFAVGNVSKTAQTAALTATTFFTVGSTNTLFNAYASVACDSSSAAATVTVTITYTDVSSTSQTLTSTTATCTALGTSSVGSLNAIFMAKTATVIQYSTTIANTPTYDVRVNLTQQGLN